MTPHERATLVVTLLLGGCSDDAHLLAVAVERDAAPACATAGELHSEDAVWSPLSVMEVVSPDDFGAVGDGVSDDQPALAAAIEALPASGGIVYLSGGRVYRKNEALVVSRNHVKWWTPNGQAQIFQSTGGQPRRQAIVCRDVEGCGFFGVSFRSDATERFMEMEDHQIAADHASLVEVVGCELHGSAATGLFLYGTQQSYVEGNYVHHTWGDHIHHTGGARRSWVWDNAIFNEAPSRGSDAVIAVTYGPASPRCGEMEWWDNTLLHTDWGRGYAVVGGDDILIHDNWAIGAASAGISVASEPSYDTSSSRRIRIERNYVYRAAHAVDHPGILISGMNEAAEPLEDIALSDNVVVDTSTGEPYREEGALRDVTNTGLSTSFDSLPAPVPSAADARVADTSVLRTRDVSHVPAETRPGLYRIHVRRAESAFEQRFEYIVKGSPAILYEALGGVGCTTPTFFVLRTVGDVAYARVLVAIPIELPPGVSGVDFAELREGARSGELAWLWERVNGGGR